MFSAARIGARHTSTLMRTLAEELPMTEAWKHLKRVRSAEGKGEKEVLLRPRDEALPQSVVSLARGLGGQIYEQRVPTQIPRRREEFEVAKVMWPMGFYPMEPKGCSKAEAEEILHDNFHENSARFMAEARKDAALSAARSFSAIGAIVVDPEKREVIAKSSDFFAADNAAVAVAHEEGEGAEVDRDMPSGHPLHTAVMRDRCRRKTRCSKVCTSKGSCRLRFSRRCAKRERGKVVQKQEEKEKQGRWWMQKAISNRAGCVRDD